MARTMLIVVSDDQLQVERARSFGQSLGLPVKTYSTDQWQKGLQDPNFRTQVGGDTPSLAVGSQPVDEGAKILPFPGAGHNSTVVDDPKKVRTINELESIAIENAIYEYNGNLTEAAKALGIGRATLYRKVKQYSIDPSQARKKRAA